MKRALLLLPVAVGLFIGPLTAPAVADPDVSGLTPHPHVLLIDPKLDATGDNLVSVRKCVDIGANQALPLTAHHHALHFGKGGEKLFENAGHLVVPVAPFPEPFAKPLPWTDCASLLAFFGVD